MYKGLYLDDDYEKLTYLKEILESVCVLEICSDPRIALKNIQINKYDFIVIDIRMPQMNGFDFIKTAQENDLLDGAKLFILSTLQDDETKIRGLSLCITDYLSFAMSDEEIRLRITNHLGVKVAEKGKYKFKEVLLDSFNSSVQFKNHEISLTPLEYRIMLTLINFSGMIPDSNKLKEYVWTEEVVSRQTVNTHISNLKKKLGHSGLVITRNTSGGLSLEI